MKGMARRGSHHTSHERQQRALWAPSGLANARGHMNTIVVGGMGKKGVHEVSVALSGAERQIFWGPSISLATKGCCGWAVAFCLRPGEATVRRFTRQHVRRRSCAHM